MLMSSGCFLYECALGVHDVGKVCLGEVMFLL
jgi:hypothetical protein